MLGGHEEITRFWWMVGGLFGDVVSAGAIGVVPVAGESLSKDRIERFLHASAVDNHVKKRTPLFHRDGVWNREMYGGLMCHPLR